MSFNSITVRIVGNNISIDNKGSPINSPIPNNFNFNNSLSGSQLQYLMRKLDCIKDGKEGEGITNKKEIMNKIFPGQDNFSDDTLKTIRDQLLNENENLISPDSWLKSSSCTVSYDYIKNVFYETGLDPEDYIVDFKNPSEKSFSMVGSFPSEIGDPGSRRPEKFNQRFPNEGISLIFEPSFMNYFGFGDQTTYKATLKDIIDKVGTYDYSIDLGPAFNNENNVFGAEIRPREDGELDMDRFSTTTKFGVNEEFQSCNKTFPLLNSVTADEYFKGNNYKNSLINVLYNKNRSDNLPEIKRYLMVIEMGDVMQVLLMMIWQLVQQNPNDKKNYCMTSLDSIVFMLCIILEQPCMYTHNSNKGLEKEDKCYRLQYYYPAIITEEERIKTRFNQKYIEIFNSNLKIKNFYNRIFIEKVIYIGNTRIEYSNDKRKLDNLNTYFFTPIQTAFEEISQGLENYKTQNENGILNEGFLNEMHEKFFILPIFGLKEKNKKKNYYINPGIRNYTAEREYVLNGVENPSFWEVFQKIYSNTLSLVPVTVSKRMRGGSAQTNDIGLIPNEPIIMNSVDNKSSFSPDNNEILDTDEEQIPLVTDNTDDEQPPLITDNTESSIDKDRLPMEEEDQMQVENPTEPEQLNGSTLDLSNTNDVKDENKMNIVEPNKEEEESFTKKLFLTFISQVVNNLKNNSDLQLTPEDNEFGILDPDAIYYFYYDMLVYISYIKKYVYYDDNLMELMKKLKLYTDKQNTLANILKIPIPIIEMGLEEDELEGCKTNTNLIQFSGIEYMNELFDTFNAMKNEILKSDQEMSLEYINKMEPEEENQVSDKMDVVNDLNEIGNQDNEVNFPETIDELDDQPSKRARNAGGTKKKKVKKVKKTRKANRKRSIKKKPSRRKQKKTRRKSFK